MTNNLNRYRKKTQRTIQAALEAEETSVIATLPNTGKTTSFFREIKNLDVNGTLFQPNHDLRDETQQEAEDFGLSVFQLPSFMENSVLLDEETRWHDPRVEDWRDRGMYPRRIMNHPDVETPTASEAPEDSYIGKMEQDWSGYDLLIGDPIHAHLDNATEDRTIPIYGFTPQ